MSTESSNTYRSRKDLACTRDAQEYQKQFGRDLKTRVVENGEPFAIVQADTPHEIFHVMDIPVITNQWWAAYISAKQLSSHYSDVLRKAGFSESSCRYCSLGLGCTLDNDPSRAPWGGLPKPTVLVARMTCDCVQHVFSLWADALGAPFYPLEAPGWTEKIPNWWEIGSEQWESVYQSERIDLMVEELKGLIHFLEIQTGRQFDDNNLLDLMKRINQQEEVLGEAARLAIETVPCPVSIVDQMPNTMIPQWHRGSDWAIQHARRFRDEIQERVKQGSAVYKNERIRLMWIGAGLWHDIKFYHALEERYGAVFVWSMYLPFASKAYPRFNLVDPLRALASRVVSMNEVLHLPPWMNQWMVSEAKRARIDAVVILTPNGARFFQSGLRFTKHGLEETGIPVLNIPADMVDATGWDHEKMVGYVGRFLNQHFPS